MIKYLLKKEFLQIRRNAFLPRLIFIFPIMVMCVAPWIMNMEVKNVNVAIVIFVMWFFVVCMMLLSGLFTPVSSMPEWAQWLTALNPVRHYVDAMRTVFIRGGGLASVGPQPIALTVFAIAFDLMAVVSYRKNN